ncbi:LRR receptor-like serine/threonine-protein kinase [Hirschfeldia incana]|nr:LRR receptor-like serine/threonine-protein kinase [Hirschfeldia incana]
MGFGFWGYALILPLFLKQVCCQEPNTDGFFVSEFFKQMSSSSPQVYNFSAPFCSWQGLFCDSKNEHVTVLIASGMGLSGPIPDTTLGKLSKLQSLDLSNNRISALPSDFWSLTTLKNLNLSFNQISGSFPSNAGNFGQLESLDVSHNNFSGQIPEAVDSLISLRVLKFDHNGFQMSIPRGLLGCQSLVSIDLSSNQLEGSLPDEFGSAFPKLKTLNIAGNKIHGRGGDFADMKSITSLNISRNEFEGSAAGLLKETLEVADLSKNRFQGHISQVDSNWTSLVYLDLSENELSGDIFKNLKLLKKLKHLNLACNRFNRGVFPRIEMISGLEYLNLSNTNLSGHIPREISELSELSTLDVSGNHLSGNIPMLSIKNLVAIDVSRNNLTGEIPMSIIEKLQWMESFNFSYNNLTFCTEKLSPETLSRSFFGSTSSCPIAANPALFKRRRSATGVLKVALAVTLSAMFLLIAALVFVAFGHKRKVKTSEAKDVSVKEEQSISGPFSFQTDSTTWVADVKQANAVPVVIFEKPLLNITFSDLLSATSHFDRDTLLAEGKFGPVYRGFLPGGIHVAVKVLVHGSTLSDQEAARELEFLGRIKHPNLVPLTGYCIAGDQRIAIYEYMENGNLQNLLQDLPFGVQTTDDWSTDTWEEEGGDNGIQNIGPEGPVATWRFRHMIALGTARALAFLHHGCSPPMIHRDVKASSVYLDQNWEPRLSDFGLAKVFGSGLDDEVANGSPGYLPPEFLQPEQELPTPKSDVYCFGVVLFELVTGKKPVEDEYLDEKDTDLVTWVRSLVRKSQGSTAIDPKIQQTGSEDQMEEALKIGYLCTADLPSKRPSMQQVVGLLKDIEPKPNQ